MRQYYSKGTHVTKEGKTATKGLWYNIAQKKKVEVNQVRDLLLIKL